MQGTLANLLAAAACIGLISCINSVGATFNDALIRHSRTADGKPLSLGQFTPLAHNFSTGEAIILNERQIKISNVWYDGLGPDAYWIITNSDKISDERPEFVTGEFTVIADETGSCGIAKPYKGQEVVLTLPETMSFGEIKYISLYCIQYDHNFGYIKVPEAIIVPDFDGTPSTECATAARKAPSRKTDNVVGTRAPYTLGKFTPFAHNFSTADSIIVNEKQVSITNVWYDGLGPAAYWIVSNSDKILKERPKLSSSDYTIIPDEAGSCGIAKAYKGKNVTLTLPANMNFSKIKYISMYCVRFDHNFGYVRIPDEISVPNYDGNTTEECLPFEKKISAITIGGIVVGVIAALGLIIGGVVVYFKCIRKK